MTARRHDFDFYETPSWQTRALLRRVPLPLRGSIWEPCCGEGAIARVLQTDGGVAPARLVLTDLVARLPGVIPNDMTAPTNWATMRQTYGPPAAVITNPGFRASQALVPLAWAATVPSGGLLAVLLRLSWLEPTDGRQAFLAAHPPTGLIVLPRTAYRTGTSTDSVTTAWMVWSQSPLPACSIVTKDERDALIALEGVAA